ncbi:MAG: response regulator transcription factor [Clostridiales bacterium]|nr:response regulator transcription factor [Clostridiales bacterium]
MAKILVVDDEVLLRNLIKDYLLKDNHEVIEAFDGKEGLSEYYKNDDIDLVLLDVMMPIYDGWTVLKEIRKSSDVPVIMLTARSQDTDELYGFELGANDYITKPFKPNILMARVRAHLKNDEAGKDNELFKFNDLIIDITARRIMISDRIIELSPKEYDLLIYLAENKGSALSRNQILDNVWGFDYFGDLRTVDTHIKRLRIKLEDQSNLVQTIRGYGYRFEVEN